MCCIAQISDILFHYHWTYIVGGYLFIWLSLFLFMTLFIYKTKLPFEIEFNEVSPDSSEIPSNVQNQLIEFGINLRELGFEMLGTHLQITDLGLRIPIMNVGQVWIHRNHQTEAIVDIQYQIVTDNTTVSSEIKILKSGVTFMTKYENNIRTISTNQKSLLIFVWLRANVLRKILWVFWSNDISFLYRLHRVAVKKEELISQKIFPIETEFNWDYRKESIVYQERLLRENTEKGYWVVSQQPEMVGFTFKGALMVAWRQVPFFPGWSKLLARFRIFRLMKTSGYENALAD